MRCSDPCLWSWWFCHVRVQWMQNSATSWKRILQLLRGTIAWNPLCWAPRALWGPGSGTVWSSGDFGDITVKNRLQGEAGLSIFAKQSTQSGGGDYEAGNEWGGTCSSHHRCWADRKRKTRQAAHTTRPRNTTFFFSLKSKLQMTVHNMLLAFWTLDCTPSSTVRPLVLSNDRQYSSILHQYTKHIHR